MIKKLKNKFLICLFLLVTVFSVTSSCFALTFSSEVLEAPVSSNDFISYVLSTEEFKNNFNNSWISFFGGSSDINNWTLDVISYIDSSDGITYYALVLYPNTLAIDYYYYKNNCFVARNVSSSSDKITAYMIYSYSNNTFTYLYSAAGYNNCKGYIGNDIIKFYNSTTVTLKNSSNVVYEPLSLSVNVTHEFQSDTSAKVNFTVNNAPDGAILKYSLTGVELNTDLTVPLQLKNPVIYSPRSN